MVYYAETNYSFLSESLKWRPDPNFLQDVREERLLVCDECVKWQNTTALIGQTVFLSCPVNHSPSTDLPKDAFWVHNKTRLTKDSKAHRIHKTEDGLILTALRQSDSGQYEVYVGHNVICRISLSVDQGNSETRRGQRRRSSQIARVFMRQFFGFVLIKRFRASSLPALSIHVLRSSGILFISYFGVRKCLDIWAWAGHAAPYRERTTEINPHRSESQRRFGNQRGLWSVAGGSGVIDRSEAKVLQLYSGINERGMAEFVTEF